MNSDLNASEIKTLLPLRALSPTPMENGMFIPEIIEKYDRPEIYAAFRAAQEADLLFAFVPDWHERWKATEKEWNKLDALMRAAERAE